MTESAGYAPVPGPADRTSFFAAQARHRRASWWFTLLSALAIVLMGIPLSAVLSPLLYALALIVFDVVNVFVRVSVLFQGVAQDAGSSNGPLSPAATALALGALILPGSLALYVAWLAVRRLFRRAGSGGAVLALGAREPRGGDFEEQQLAHVVEEMAVAAGVEPAPRVMLRDDPVPEAFAVGTGPDDAVVLVTTGVLRTLDREETQGLVAHLVAAIGNGDLRIGGTIGSVFRTLGLVGAVLGAPAEKQPRQLVRRVLRYAFRRPGAEDAAVVADALAQEAELSASEPTPPQQTNGVKAVLQLPFLMASLAFMATTWIFTMVLVNPFLRRGWRARRYLADASAVELTRDPDGLARALALLGARQDLPKRKWLVGQSDDLPARVARLNAMGAAVAVPGRALPTRGRTMVRVLMVVTSPCWLSVFALLLGLALMLTTISLMVDSMFLAPLVAVVHVALRALAT